MSLFLEPCSLLNVSLSFYILLLCSERVVEVIDLISLSVNSQENARIFSFFETMRGLTGFHSFID